jgi:hypothetical protein
VTDPTLNDPITGDPLRVEEPAAQAVVTSVHAGESPGRRFRRRFRRERGAMIGLGFLVFAVLCAVFAPVLAPHDPDAQTLSARLQAFSWEHMLGTDDLGRDVLSRLLFASRVSLIAAVQATAIGVVLGVPIGLLAGYTRGWFDNLVSRIADAIMSIPALLLALAIVGVLEPNLTSAMVAIGIVYAPRLFRVTRAAALSVREETLVTCCPTCCRRSSCRSRCRWASRSCSRRASASSASVCSHPTRHGVRCSAGRRGSSSRARTSSWYLASRSC